MSKPEDRTDLGTSFRQSRRELWFMVATWAAFAAWTAFYNANHAFEKEAPLETLWGLPRWVALGVAIPWTIAMALTIWFASCYMKDTDLGGDHDEFAGGESGS